ncbi:MAG: hypothetical protein IKN38_01730 [Clostridia bacterium]|nr:hypothetical protein [Clostridia bacterium]
MSDNNINNRRREPDDEGWVYPDRVPGGYYGAAYGAGGRRPASGASVKTPPRPERRQAPQNAPRARRDIPPRTAKPAAPRRPAAIPPQSGIRPSGAVRQTPPRTSRPGVRTHSAEYVKKDKKKKYLLIGAVIAVIILIIIIASSTGKSDAGAPSADTGAVTDEATSPPETEAEPPSAKVYPPAVRTDLTKELGDEISCTHAVLIDVDSNTIVAAKGEGETIYPASMTKVMTALVAVEKCKDLSGTYSMDYDIVAKAYEANASSAGFAPGEVLTFKDLLYGAILPSGADGTGGLAEFTAGSEAEFAKLMNEKCEELGLKGTHFSNASGLHAADHYTTCVEMAIIMRAAMDNPLVSEVLGTPEYVTSKTEAHPDGIELHHTLLYERLDGSEEFDEKIEVIGGKTGFTGEAGNCLVTMAKVVSSGKRYIFVCAGGDGKWAPVFDTIHVYRAYLGEHYDGEFIPKSQR